MKFTKSTEKLARKQYWQKHIAFWCESNLSQVGNLDPRERRDETHILGLSNKGGCAFIVR